MVEHFFHKLTFTHPIALCIYFYAVLTLSLSWMCHYLVIRLKTYTQQIQRRQKGLQQELKDILSDLKQLEHSLDHLNSLPKKVRESLYIPTLNYLKNQTLLIAEPLLTTQSWWVRLFGKSLIREFFRQLKKSVHEK